MPPFAPPPNSLPTLPQSPPLQPTPSTTSSGASTSSTPSISSIFKSFGRNVSKAVTGAELTTAQQSRDKDALRRDAPAGTSPAGSGPRHIIGSSSRGAGVKPKRSVSANVPSSQVMVEPAFATGLNEFTTELLEAQRFSPGPSRGGFAATPKGSALFAASKSPPASPLASTSSLNYTVASSLGRPRSVEVLTHPEPMPERDVGPVLPPSKILPRLAAASQRNDNPAALVSLVRLLAKSVSLYPFPPPTLSATSLSTALTDQFKPDTEAPSTPDKIPPLPTPSPLEIYLSQSHLLSFQLSADVRSAALSLLQACVEASLRTTGGIREVDRATYWDEVRRWSEEAKIEVKVAQEEETTRWTLPADDREALVAILSVLTKGGRDLSDVPGLVAMLCAFVTDSLPSPAPPSPLFDPTLSTPFTRSSPPKRAAHSSALALLIALHKFSASHIFTASTLLALQAMLEVAKLPEERDIGGDSDSDVLSFLGAVIRYGEVSGKRRQLPESGSGVEQSAPDAKEGDEILREVVAVVARIVGCEGLVGAVAVGTASIGEGVLFASVLPSLALDLMRDLLRSPANQALKNLRSLLVAPPSTSPRPPAPVLLLVGALRSLRKALMEHSLDTEANVRTDSTTQSTGESRWPSLLSLGLPFLWNGICRVLLWGSEHVDHEAIRLVEERLDAAERLGVRSKESQGYETTKSEDSEAGISFEEWDMAVEVLVKTKWHIQAWEDLHEVAWVLETDAPFDQQPADLFAKAEPSATFVPRQTVLVPFSSLLRRLIKAWGRPGFSGPSDKVFAFLVSVAPHLSDETATLLIDQCEAQNLCTPTHPEWLERIQEIASILYTYPERNTSTSRFRQAASPSIRRRMLTLLATLHSHVRELDSSRDELIATVLLPLIETSLETETDAGIIDALLALLLDFARDALVKPDSSPDDSPLEVIDRIRLLLLRVARGSVRPIDRYSSSVPTTPKQKRANFPTLSRYHKDSSPTTMRSAASISAPVASAPSPLDATDLPYLAVLALISLFHICLARSDHASAEHAIVVFRDVLSLLVSNISPSSDTPDLIVPVRTRLVILQWLVRLRADAAHRVHWVRNVDITPFAITLGRVDVQPSDTVADALATAVRTSEDGNRPDMRGRVARGADAVSRSEPRGRSMRPQDSGSRDPSANRLRKTSQDRSPSRSASVRRPPPPAVAPAPVLWTVPEILPFDFGDGTITVGSEGLASFDHNQMRDWTEEEDPGTGLMKVKQVEDTTPNEDFVVVLPVSEYLKAVNLLLQEEKDWELLAYLLCHLPQQLANKHFSCGPRASQQIHTLRQFLCDGLRGGPRALFADIALPPTLKRAEVHATAYRCLTTLIAYRSLFNKSQQDSIVGAFMHGLSNPRDTAKSCIHALAVASFELRPSMTKHLAETVRHLQKIISSATLGVHILEFIAGVGQIPSLYANFTELDFQTVFGIALKYIQAHNERLADNPDALDSEEGIEYAFSQYVFLLAYYTIAAWYMALRLSERPKYVAFLTRRLVQANEGKPEIDEPTEVCFDMIARYAYSNADPRPRQSSFDKIIVSGRPNAPPSLSKTWIVGMATVTVKSTPSPAWVEVTIRRASGVVKMLWELQNISGVMNSSDGELMTMYLRHRETTLAQSGVRLAISEALSSLPDARSTPHLGRRARSSSFAGSSESLSQQAALEDDAIATAMNATAAVAAQPSLESGVLAVDPSFFTLQLSSFPEQGSTGPPILVPNDHASQRGISALDRMPVVDFHKIGVLYAAPGQRSEKEILCNTHGSKAYIELISALGQLVRLKGSRDLDMYAGGLDQETDIDGRWTYLWDDDISQIVFHVATLMPTSPETDPQATRKKSHIGNDFVKIVFNESGSDFAFDTLPGDFNFVNIIIEPHTPAGNPWTGPGMTNNTEYFKVSMQCRPGMPEVGFLGMFQMVTGSSLPDVVRQLSLHSNIFAQVYLASVGFEARQGQQKVEYQSNWRKRLQQIKLLKKRVLEASGTLANPAESQRLDMDQAETARLFTNWL